jgi:hypothetical protein
MNSKNAFWQALVFALIIFGLGLIFGFFLEVKQSDSVFFRLVDSEINILDDQIRTRIIEDFEVDCGLAKESLFNFADKIYEEAQELEELDTDGRLKDLIVLHRRYDLLRTLLWVESKELQEECKEDFHTLVYLYEYKSEDVNVRGKQSFYSRLLFDLKTEYPEEVILIPIAVDTGLESVELIYKANGVEEFPVIILDSEIKIQEILTLQEFKDLVFNESIQNNTIVNQ